MIAISRKTGLKNLMGENTLINAEKTMNLRNEKCLAGPAVQPFERRAQNFWPPEFIGEGERILRFGQDAGSSFERGEALGNNKEPRLPFAFVFDEKKKTADCFSWQIKSTEAMKVTSARQMLRNLDRQYERIFENQTPSVEDNSLKGESFLNSYLLYLIAATDGHEDTLGHSQRVTSYSVLLAKAVGIENKDFLLNIERGALLHDIGKIGIQESILRKAGPLTEWEKEIVKEHPVLGYEMIAELDLLKRAALVVLFHHENHDGSGYPYGLVGEEIPLEARIFTLVDGLDAMTSDRPYSRGRSFDAAYREIERSRGSQYDPFLVDVFLSVPKEEWQRINGETQISGISPTIH
jgi:putative nucleotidyltransferase with HDIG domain